MSTSVRIEIDNNVGERSLRKVRLGWTNYLLTTHAREIITE